MQEREIGSVTGRLPDNPGELEYMYTFKKSAKLLGKLTKRNTRGLPVIVSM